MMKSIFTLCALMALLLTVSIQYPLHQHAKYQGTKLTAPVPHHSKHIILVVIDSLMDTPLQEAIKQERAPALQFLIKHGQYFPNVVSSFPTMSVTIDSSLLTGTYPDRHRVPGLVWYDENEGRIINYGNGKREIVKLGVKPVLQDSLYKLNNEHLSQHVKTLHEELAADGKQSASINVVVYRGNFPHQLNLPKTAAFLNILPENLKTYGPAWFSYGSLSYVNPNNQKNYIWQKYGFNDKFSSEELKYLIQSGKLPPFTIVYFPDNDHSVHKNGPMDIKGIEQADRQIQEIFGTYNSWESAIKNAVWIVMGDSGQASIGGSRKESFIRLPSLLSLYRITKLRERVQKEDQILLCVNERMAYIYSIDKYVPLARIAGHLQKDDRIDVIAWKEGEIIHVIEGGKEGVLSFRPGGQYVDPYQQRWSLQGKLSILDISTKGNQMTYHDYPDALARLYGALHSHPGRYLVVTARPGFELVGESSPTHLNGGGHGSLHKQDSLVPMLVTGTDSSPKHLRIVDIKDWILKMD
jgi:predicted AlkP superfamily pyrophosphatase or phosphodiesterase